MKFRIIKQIKRNGREMFIPQYCSFFFWHNFREMHSMDYIEEIRCTTLTKAEEYIEKFIEHQSNVNGNKIVSEVIIKEFT